MNFMRNLRHGWWFKVSALLITIVYCALLIFLNNTTYLYGSLAVVMVLFVATVTCSSTDSPILLHLRQNRQVSPSPNESDEDTDARVWTTDVPPSYSVVMSTEICPPTPPPSYGSAILMIPPPYTDGKDTPGRLRPLSISTQVSVCSNSVPGSPQPREARVTFSTQISVVEPGDSRLYVSRSKEPIEDFCAETLQLRTRLFLSRQASREDSSEDPPQQATQLPVLVLNEQSDGSLAPQLTTRVYFSRQASREELSEDPSHAGNQQQIIVLKEQLSRVTTPILRTRVFLSRQASKEEATEDGSQSVNQGQFVVLNEQSSLATDSSLRNQSYAFNHAPKEGCTEDTLHTASSTIRTRVYLSRQASKEELSYSKTNAPFPVLDEQPTASASPEKRNWVFLSRQSSKDDDPSHSTTQVPILIIHDQPITASVPEQPTTRVFFSRQASREDVIENPSEIPIILINNEPSSSNPVEDRKER